MTDSEQRTALLVWELGAGLGHIAPLAAVASDLSARNFRIVYAVADQVSARQVVARIPHLGPDGTPRPPIILQAPRPRVDRADQSPDNSYADILMRIGYADLPRLSAMVDAWSDLYALVKPDLIVADHSPTACLASRDVIPTVILGNGFTLPTVEQPQFPALSKAPEKAMQSLMLKVVNAALTDRGRRPVTQLTEIAKAQARFVCTVPELDPYVSVRREPYCGPVQARPPLTPAVVNPHLFVYLTADFSVLPALAGALADITIPVTCHVPDLPESMRVFLESRGVTVLREPAVLEEVLPKASTVLSHGGSGIVHATLFAGRPQLLLPLHFEQRMTADALERMGVARRLREESAGLMSADIMAMVQDAALADAAYRAGESLRRRDRGNPLPLIAAVCDRLAEPRTAVRAEV